MESNNKCLTLSTLSGKEENAKMRDYVRDLAEDKMERVRISEIGECSLGLPNNMFEVNRFRQLGKYDIKQGILYFNHGKRNVS